MVDMIIEFGGKRSSINQLQLKLPMSQASLSNKLKNTEWPQNMTCSDNVNEILQEISSLMNRSLKDKQTVLSEANEKNSKNKCNNIINDVLWKEYNAFMSSQLSRTINVDSADEMMCSLSINLENCKRPHLEVPQELDTEWWDEIKSDMVSKITIFHIYIKYGNSSFTKILKYGAFINTSSFFRYTQLNHIKTPFVL